MLFVSIYNDQGRQSRAWRRVKQHYDPAGPALRLPPFAVAVMLPLTAKLTTQAVRGHPSAYLRKSTPESGQRGMSGVGAV